jgi:hypothetical protein
VNARVLELANLVAGEIPGAWNISDEFCEKFARLIVEECAIIADIERPNYVGCGYITKTAGDRIKEHFGFES